MDTVNEVTRAIGRFLGFFFALVVALTVAVTAYALIQGASSQVWTALETLLIIDAVLLVFSIGAAIAAHFVAHGSLPQRNTPAAPTEVSAET
jgi:putative copper export protein